MSARTARELLGLGPLAGPEEIGRAFRSAAKTTHPDRPGGSAARFRELVAAYRRLKAWRPGAAAERPQAWRRGDELWLRTPVPARVLAEGGRLSVATPLGERVVWITRRAARAGLIRLEGLVLLLTADETIAESPARRRLDRFAAAWAA